MVFSDSTQLTLTCSKSTVETVDKGLTIKTIDVVLVFLLLNLNIFHTFLVLEYVQI